MNNYVLKRVGKTSSLLIVFLFLGNASLSKADQLSCPTPLIDGTSSYDVALARHCTITSKTNLNGSDTKIYCNIHVEDGFATAAKCESAIKQQAKYMLDEIHDRIDNISMPAKDLACRKEAYELWRLLISKDFYDAIISSPGCAFWGNLYHPETGSYHPKAGDISVVSSKAAKCCVDEHHVYADPGIPIPR